MGFLSSPPGLTWEVSTIRARWPSVTALPFEGGLSSTCTDHERGVRGHVTKVTQALRKSFKWSPCHLHEMI